MLANCSSVSYLRVSFKIEIAPSVPNIILNGFPEICLGSVPLPENFTITGIVIVCTFGGQ